MLRACAILIACVAGIALTGAAVLIGRVLSPMTDVLAYSSRNDIWLTDIARDLTYNLTSIVNRDVNNAPAWSPDGRQLAFTTIRNSRNSRPHGEIAVIEIATRNVALLTEEISWDDYPAWSPDGRWIAFRTDRETHAGMGVYVIDMENLFAPPSLLVRDSGIALIPAWSPDGKSIVMTLNVDDIMQVIAVDVEQGTGAQLLPRAAYHPQLSPDAARLAAWIPAVDGYALAVGPVGGPLEAVSESHMNPVAFAWSPDGTAIAYGSTENARSVIRQVDTETGATRVLLTAPAFVSGVSWRP